MLPHPLHPRGLSARPDAWKPDEGHPDRHRGWDCAGTWDVADRPQPAALEDAPARPDDPADAVDVGEAAIGPVRISGIVGLDGEAPAERIERDAVHHQCVVDAEHVNPVTQ